MYLVVFRRDQTHSNIHMVHHYYLVIDQLCRQGRKKTDCRYYSDRTDVIKERLIEELS
jgi:hypothetical protein